MNSTSRRASAAAAAAVGMLGLLSTTARADTIDPDKPTRTYTEERTNPVTGEKETATVTEYPDVVKHGDGGGSDRTDRSYASGTNPITGEPGRVTVTVTPGTTMPAPGTGGLFLRDAGGAIKGLMGEGDRARVLTCHPGNPNLVKVQQLTGGHGGWGAYIGYVKIAATADPSSIGCG
ncbi:MULTISPECIES: hypothetical protein [Streptomyces]|uniref:Secreted protein n=1 Tax=Streptomyces griseiscabiei TaxID=2993540 RepID=A0ABU4LE51_9ACTN|nr:MULTISPECIES: hypothetical protein [Streptomyces]MBZ3908359.1 hypothetical protein [Streptomyces griseiscabiei]MDX2913873.1 hypothetical protein [Streptomyces griseiscabiei]